METINFEMVLKNTRIGQLGVAIFNQQGGHVVFESFSDTLKFDTVDIVNKKRFLVVFLGRHFPNLDCVIFDNITIKFEEPSTEPFMYEYISYDDGKIKRNFYESISFNDIELSDISVFDFAKYSTVKEWIRFSKNDAINEILNYNDVSLKTVQRGMLVQAMHEGVLRGHTEIPDDIRGTYWKVYSVNGRFKGYKVSVKSFKGNGKSNVFKIPE